MPTAIRADGVKAIFATSSFSTTKETKMKLIFQISVIAALLSFNSYGQTPGLSQEFYLGSSGTAFPYQETVCLGTPGETYHVPWSLTGDNLNNILGLNAISEIAAVGHVRAIVVQYTVGISDRSGGAGWYHFGAWAQPSSQYNLNGSAGARTQNDIHLVDGRGGASGIGTVNVYCSQGPGTNLYDLDFYISKPNGDSVPKTLSVIVNFEVVGFLTDPNPSQ